MRKKFTEEDISRIIEMAWEDRTPFEAIEYQFGLKENGVRKIMRTHLKRSSFELWRKRVKGKKTKHKYYNFLFHVFLILTVVFALKWIESSVVFAAILLVVLVPMEEFVDLKTYDVRN